MSSQIYPRDFFQSQDCEQIQSDLCFVLMPFDEAYRQTYDQAIKAGIEECGLRCLRADDIYSTGPILVDIMRRICEATVVVADLTDRNPNVLYEVGLAHVAKRNERVVLLSRRQDDIPFDLRHLRLILYEDGLVGMRKLKEDLKNVLTAMGQCEGSGVVSTRPVAAYQLGVGSATVSPGGVASVPIWARAPAPGIGAYTIDVRYDASLVQAEGCGVFFGVCNHHRAKGVARFVGADAAGIVGAVTLGHLTLRAGKQEGLTPIKPDIQEFIGSDFSDLRGLLDVTPGEMRVVRGGG